MLRAAKNGSSGDITFYGKKVYHKWDRGDITISAVSYTHLTLPTSDLV